MKKYAKIIDGKIDSIKFEADKKNGFVEISDDVFAGFTDDGNGEFKAPPKPVKNDVPDPDIEAAIRLLAVGHSNEIAILAQMDRVEKVMTR